VPLCNQDEFFMEPKEIKKDIALEKVFTIAEISEEVNKLQECKGFGINKLEVLPSMEDIHHDTTILHDFEDLFMRKESARDESYNFFKFILLTIPVLNIARVGRDIVRYLLFYLLPIRYGEIVRHIVCSKKRPIFEISADKSPDIGR